MSKTEKTVHDQLVSIQEKLNAPKGQHNAFGGYNYRSCEDILSAVKPLLGNCVVTLTDSIVNHQDRYYVQAVATLTDGKEAISVSAYAREAESKKGMDESQITGSASSYARKYALNGLFAIDDVRDADTRDNRETPAPKKATTSTETGVSATDVDESLNNPDDVLLTCEVCGKPAVHKEGTSAKGKDWEAIFCSTGEKDHAKWL